MMSSRSGLRASASAIELGRSSELGSRANTRIDPSLLVKAETKAETSAPPAVPASRVGSWRSMRPCSSCRAGPGSIPSSSTSDSRGER